LEPLDDEPDELDEPEDECPLEVLLGGMYVDPVLLGVGLVVVPGAGEVGAALGAGSAVVPAPRLPPASLCVPWPKAEAPRYGLFGEAWTDVPPVSGSGGCGGAGACGAAGTLPTCGGISGFLT